MKHLLFILFFVQISLHCIAQNTENNDSSVIKMLGHNSAIVCVDKKCLACFYELKQLFETNKKPYVVLILKDSLGFINNSMYRTMFEIFNDSSLIFYVSISSLSNIEKQITFINYSPAILLNIEQGNSNGVTLFTYDDIFEGITLKDSFIKAFYTKQ